jgi:epoxyqueuosine reductase
LTQSDHTAQKRSKRVKELADQLGFAHCGISKAGFLENEAPRLEAWLTQNMQGQMHYMENHFDMRLNPTLLVPGAKTVISLLFNYHNPEEQKDPNAPKISQYARGEDYHFVLKRKLKELLKNMRSEFGDVGGRVFVDSAPVLDKTWAAKSGLGWIGKHTNLIHKQAGSYFFIAELIVDLELEEDHPVQDHCGSCTKCIDACPTNAIIQPYMVDGSKCISYFTIELKDSIPEPMSGKFDNWMFGCDICQEVCPWNRFSRKHQEPAFEPRAELLEMTKQDWIELTEDTFKELFQKSAVKRTGYEGLKRNIKFLE